MRPTLYNAPLPRMKPQPLAVTMMIAKRRRIGERRLEKISVLKEMLEDLESERLFEEGLERLVRGRYRFQQVYGGKLFNEWGKCSLRFGISRRT